MKTRDRLWQLTIFFIIAVFATIHAAEVAEGDILTAARKWIADNAVFKLDAPNAVPEKAEQLTDADDKAMPLWRVDLSPTGYLVMSSDDTLPPVVTFNTSGSLDMPKGHPLPDLLKRQGEIFQEELDRPQTRGNEFAQENQARWNVLLGRTRASSVTPSEIITSPMLTTKWNQNTPYDYFCPSGENYINRAITGCVATAFAQILKYHEWPPAGMGSLTHQDNGNGFTGSFQADYSFPYDWSLMRDNHKDNWNSSYPKTNVSRTDWECARLMFEMGVVARADYKQTSTLAYNYYFNDFATSKLGYSTNMEYGQTKSDYAGYVPQGTLYPRIIADVAARRVALISGERYEDDVRYGHSFVADGLSTMDSLNYCHFNFGWSGWEDGWYLLTDASSSCYVVDGASTNIMPKPIPVFKPMSVEQASSFTLAWDFPKRLTAESFRLTKTSGSASTVVSSSIAGTARSYSMTGQSGTSTYTLEAKVDGVWQEASNGVTVTVKTNPAPMLSLMFDDEMNCVAGLPFSASITANNTLQSLTVMTSRPDMVPDSSITVTGSGNSRTISFTPAKDLVGNVILYLTGVDTVGNVVKQTALLRVLENTLTWNTSFSTAMSRALLMGKLVLMVSGEGNDDATNEFIETVCEDADVKANLLRNFELWDDSTLSGRSEYASDLGDARPFIVIIDPTDGTRLRGHGGFMTADEVDVFLDPLLLYFSLQDEVLASGKTYSLELSVLGRNAEIHYRMDASEPTLSDTLYTTPLQLSEAATISARAFKNGLPVSDTVTKTYTFLPQVATPVLSTDEREFFSGSITVTATCATAGATIRYTTDGSVPTASSFVFPTAGLTVTEDTTITVRAFKDGMMPSECISSQLFAYLDSFQYTVYNGMVTITGIWGTISDLVIPSSIDGYPVVGIDYGAFEYDDNLRSVTISEGVSSIGSDAFYSCDNLTSVTIPSSVETIGSYAFGYCSNLTSVTISEGVSSIGNYAFYSCDNLTSVTIPSSVETIGSYAFGYCSNLTSVTILEGVLSIGNEAFCDCSSLTSVTIPSSVETIGSYAFEYCSNLTSVTISEGVSSIGNYAFYSCNNLMSVTIPSSVETIGSYAFGYCSSLTFVTISEGVSSIGNYAFYYCRSLANVTIPSTVESIGDYVFSGCTSLASITVEAVNVNYTSVNGILFNKSKTTLMRYPPAKPESQYAILSSVTAIADGAFDNCRSLSSVTIPTTVKTIGASAFSGCTSLTMIGIPASVTSIGNNAFNSCTALASITVDAANTNYASVDGILFNKSKNTLVRYPPAKSGTEYAIPATVTAVGYGAFNYCKGLTSVTIPESVTSIGGYAFYYCSKLTSVAIPSSVTSMGIYAFGYCSSLTSMVIPEGVTSIGNYSFYYCTSLTSVTIPSSVASIGNYTFYHCENMKSVTISEGVTSIGSNAFGYCTALTSMTILSSVTSIGSWAFYGCSKLKEMVFMGERPDFGSYYSYPTPVTFRVLEGKGWEDWSVPSGVTLEIVPIPKQTIELTAGWNWVAFNVLPESRKAADALGEAGFTANDIIQTSGGMTRFTGTNWGDLMLEFGKMYQIYVSNDVTVEVVGDVCETSAVPLTAGWNWIGNVTTETILPSLLTHSGGWTAGDRIQTPGKNVIYTGEKWIPNGAVTLEPGKGCQIHAAKGGWLTFPMLYAVVDLSGGPSAESYPVRYSLNGPNLSSNKCRTTELWLRRIPAGTFIMGSPEDELGREAARETQHQVTLTQDYYIGVFECTQKQWQLVMGSNPSANIGDSRPVEKISYDMVRGTGTQAGAGWPTYGHVVDATSFMGKLQAKTGLVFDLPTEAQWEYACRAGTTTALNSGKNLESLEKDANMDEVGRYYYNQSDGRGGYSQHTTVGSYLPNAWGLYDMHGNVYEWCLDRNGSYGTEAAEDPVGSASGSYRVGRSGHWAYLSGEMTLRCRSACRSYFNSSDNGNLLGFRIALHPKQDLYAVVDLSGGPDAESYPVRYTNKMPNLDDNTCRTTELWLRKIPAGTFIMGSPEDELGRQSNETQHQVTLTQDYYIGVFECTQKQWELVMGSKPSTYKGDCRPVERVSYDLIRGAGAQAGAGWPAYGHAVDATSFMGKLQAKTGLTFDLPTEAQWEYACRAGTTTALNSGKNLSSTGRDANMAEVGRYYYNQSDGRGGFSEHTTVGCYLPNAWGLYDMHGNVSEWCIDWSGSNYYSISPKEDPTGSSTGSYHLVRDSGWADRASFCRSASRIHIGTPSGNAYVYGFRVLCLP